MVDQADPAAGVASEPVVVVHYLGDGVPGRRVWRFPQPWLVMVAFTMSVSSVGQPWLPLQNAGAAVGIEV